MLDMVRLMVNSGMVRTPMMPQMTQLRPVVILMLRSMSMPMMAAAVLFCATQRMALPGFVSLRNI